MTAPRMSDERKSDIEHTAKDWGLSGEVKEVFAATMLNDLLAALAAAEKERDAWRREAIAWRAAEDEDRDESNCCECGFVPDKPQEDCPRTISLRIRSENEAAGLK